MDSPPDVTRIGRFGKQAPAPSFRERTARDGTNSVAASQARAAHRREARRDEQAVAAWLRELSGRTR